MPSDATAAPRADAPIGVFDSGIGGLSILRALRAELPHERFIYLADSAWAPYGERDDAFVRTRSMAIADELVAAHHIKALVVACNTATAAAIRVLREQHPGMAIVGVEPALKPAAEATRTGRVGVLATRGTLASRKFADLRAALAGRTEFVPQPCDGLASAIERAVDDACAQAEVNALCARYVGMLGPLGRGAGAIDTLVLGCTHYLFAAEALRVLAGADVALIETGAPVALHTRQVLARRGLLAPPSQAGDVRLIASGDTGLLQAAAARWLPDVGVRG